MKAASEDSKREAGDTHIAVSTQLNVTSWLRLLTHVRAAAWNETGAV